MKIENFDRLTPLDGLRGHKIFAVYKITDEAIGFLTEDGNIQVFEPTTDCCEHVYIQHINGSDIFEGGATVLAFEEKSYETMPETGQFGGDVVDQAFQHLITDKGYFEIELRNEHNGYYAGALLRHVGVFNAKNYEPTKDF